MAQKRDPSFESYLKKIRKYPELTHGQEIALGQRIEQGDKEAFDHLFNCSLRLVLHVIKVKQYRSRKLSFQEIVQEGNHGLLRAVEKYDWRFGVRFGTYARWWIRQAICKAMANEPDANLSLDEKKGEYEESLYDSVPNQKATKPSDRLEKASLQDMLNSCLGLLTRKQRIVIKMRYGLLDGNVYTLEEISVELGVTQERVRQIQYSALRKLRGFKELLNSFFD